MTCNYEAEVERLRTQVAKDKEKIQELQDMLQEQTDIHAEYKARTVRDGNERYELRKRALKAEAHRYAAASKIAKQLQGTADYAARLEAAYEYTDPTEIVDHAVEGIIDALDLDFDEADSFREIVWLKR